MGSSRISSLSMISCSTVSTLSTILAMLCSTSRSMVSRGDDDADDDPAAASDVEVDKAGRVRCWGLAMVEL